MNTNYIELKEIFDGLFNKTLDLNVGLFAQIEEKRIALSEFLNVDLEESKYDESRNIYTVDSIDEEYNVLTDKEADIQAFINMYYAMVDDGFMLNVDDIRELFKISNEDICKIFNSGSSDLDLVSINNVMTYSEKSNIYTTEDLMFKLAKDMNREDFLSCDYKENRFKNYYIYKY